MGSKPRISTPPADATRRLMRRKSSSNPSRRRLSKHEADAACSHRGAAHNGGGGASVSDKLEALKNLIPSEKDAELIKPDQLFQETADYIVLLKTQVFVLQKLIDFYGSQPQENRNAL